MIRENLLSGIYLQQETKFSVAFREVSDLLKIRVLHQDEINYL